MERKMLNTEEKNYIISVLHDKISDLKCPMCGQDQFNLADSFIHNMLSDDLSMPAVAIVCRNCGFISQHAAGVLGFIEKDPEDEEKKQPEE